MAGHKHSVTHRAPERDPGVPDMSALDIVAAARAERAEQLLRQSGR